MVGLVKLLLLWYLQTNQNLKNYRGVFGEVLDTVKDTFGNLLQLLTNLKNKEIEFDFHKKINYGLLYN